MRLMVESMVLFLPRRARATCVSSALGINSRYEYTYDVPRNFLVRRYLSDDARHHSVSRMAGTSDRVGLPRVQLLRVQLLRVSDCMSISAQYYLPYTQYYTIHIIHVLFQVI